MSKDKDNANDLLDEAETSFDRCVVELIAELKKVGVEHISTERGCSTPGGGFTEGVTQDLTSCRVGGHEYGRRTALYYAFVNASKVDLAVRNNILTSRGYPKLGRGEGWLF